MNVESLFLRYSADKLRQYTDRIEVCLRKLSEEQIWARGSDAENAIGNLALHLTGNVRQWIITSVGGAPDVRDRDAEFRARGGVGAPDLSVALRNTVEEACRVILALSTEQLEKIYRIQNYEVSGVEVVYHVVEHFAQHTGQIIFATKLFTSQDLAFYRHLSDPAAEERVP